MKYMKLLSLLFIIICLLPCCTQNSGAGKIKSSTEKKIRTKAIVVAEEYIMNQVKDAKKNISADGYIMIGDSIKAFVISPSNIYVGLIDDDSKPDAIVSLDCFVKGYQVTSEHLIMINSDGKIKLNRAIESNMKVIEIKDKLITVNIPEHARNSPLFNCSSCQEVVKYKFLNGDLVKTE
jgi:hypothetical protein